MKMMLFTAEVFIILRKYIFMMYNINSVKSISMSGNRWNGRIGVYV